jgi:hypothetical protein
VVTLAATDNGSANLYTLFTTAHVQFLP